MLLYITSNLERIEEYRKTCVGDMQGTAASEDWYLREVLEPIPAGSGMGLRFRCAAAAMYFGGSGKDMAGVSLHTAWK